METLEELNRECQACRRCRIAGVRKVFGIGNPQARILLLGEGPGAVESVTGVPFSGPSGQKLNALLANAGIDRQQIYIANVVNCRTSEDNRDPSREEIQNCWRFLLGQIRCVNPSVIVALGRIAAETALFRKLPRMGEVRGIAQPIFLEGTRKVIVTWHPSFLLRQGSGQLDSIVTRDLELARREATPETGASP